MSDEKIDLAAVEEDARELWVMRRDDTLALVAAVRSAREVIDQYELGDVDHRAMKRLHAAIAPFADSGSAEVE